MTPVKLDQSLQALQREVGALQAMLQALRLDVQELKMRQKNIVAQANRWKGGFAVVLTFGAIAGWLLDKILRFYVR